MMAPAQLALFGIQAWAYGLCVVVGGFLAWFTLDERRRTRRRDGAGECQEPGCSQPQREGLYCSDHANSER